MTPDEHSHIVAEGRDLFDDGPARRAEFRVLETLAVLGEG
jgi:hypothetical protein